MAAAVSRASAGAILSSYSIGLKLRALRAAKRLTLSRLAVESGFSSALLSKLETDRMIPTLPTLSRLCAIYGVGLSYFFSDPTRHSVAITRKAHMCERTRGDQTANRTHLHAPTDRNRIFASTLDLPPGVPSTVSESGSKIETVAYVLDGQLRLTIGGSDDLLDAGDCVVLDTEETVIWCAVGKSPCRVLCVSARTRLEKTIDKPSQ
jgi:transcriptional regulator with XRE-family HTH domain